MTASIESPRLKDLQGYMEAGMRIRDGPDTAESEILEKEFEYGKARRKAYREGPQGEGPDKQGDEEKQRIRDTIELNRGAESVSANDRTEEKGICLPGECKEDQGRGVLQGKHQEDAQAGSFEMQVQHFRSVIVTNPSMSW